MPKLNPLPIIAQWLNEFPFHDCAGMSRIDLEDWVRRKFPGALTEIAVDCLIAVGIGREQEQEATVYCNASYE